MAGSGSVLALKRSMRSQPADGFGLVKVEMFVMCLGRGFDRLGLNGYLYFNGPDQ